MHDDLAVLVARMGLEPHSHPAVAVVGAFEVAGRDGVGEDEDGCEGARIAEVDLRLEGGNTDAHRLGERNAGARDAPALTTGRPMTTAVIMAAALSYQLGIAEQGFTTYGTVMMDEAFVLASEEFAGAGIKALHEFGFQLLPASREVTNEAR